MRNKKLIATLVISLASISLGWTQLMQVVKILGVGAAVQKFGPDINKAINKLSGHADGGGTVTKVVPILSGGINSRKAVGAAQVIGKKADVDRVKAVFELNQDLFGEVKVRALVPMSADKDSMNPRKVEGVGLSGLVDLKL